jgi:high affinity sulfate transporter 1
MADMSTRTQQRSSLRAQVTAVVPILSWFPQYNRDWWSKDALAGLTLWGLLVPQGMAYAGIADLPPQAGMYTLVVSLLIYALMGTSRHLSVGPTSATAALLASSVAAAVVTATVVDGATDDQTYQAHAAAFVLVTGIVFLVAGMLKLGFITQFLSKPVMDGFVMGLAIFVAVGQLNKLFGVPKPEGNTVRKFFGIIRELPEANWAAFAIGGVALLVLIGLPKVNPRIPAGLIALFGAILVSYWLDLADNRDVAVIGTLPQGLPSLEFTAVPFRTYVAMVLPAIGVFLVAFSEALGAAREFADRHGYEVDADQELNAHGATNIVSSLFGGMIASGGMSGSAVKEGAGAQTQVSNLVAWVATVITLLFLTPLFATLPESVLAALIIHAVWHIIASRKLRRLRRESKVEFWFGLLAMLGVLFIGVLEGMIIGLVASLVFLVYRSSRPYVASVGRVPGSPGAYSDLKRHPENTPVPGVLILRLHSAFYYANALTVRDRIRMLVARADPTPVAVILDIGSQDSLDLTSADVLKALGSELRSQGIQPYLADVHTPALKFSRAVGVLDVIGEDHVFPTIELAVQHIERTTGVTRQES